MKLILIAMMLFATTVEARETVSAMYTPETQRIVDGDTADWVSSSDELHTLTHLYSSTADSMRTGEDISASFKIAANKNYVYIAVDVTDDNVVFSNDIFSGGWDNDAVEICIDGDLKDITKPYFDSNDGQITVVVNQNRSVQLEGCVPYFYDTQIPYFWEARGVSAAFRENSHGYTVELAIPAPVLGWECVTGECIMGLNVRVFEDDGENDGHLDCHLSWADDPEATSFRKTECYNRVSFTPLDDGSAANKPVSHDTTVDNSAFFRQFYAYVKDKNWNALEPLFEQKRDELWSRFLLGAALYHGDLYDRGLDVLFQAAEQCTNERDRFWATEYPVVFVRELVSTRDIDTLYPESPYAAPVYILHKRILKGRYSRECHTMLLHFLLHNLKGNKHDLLLAKLIECESSDKTIHDAAVVVKARAHFINGRIQEAVDICLDMKGKKLLAEVEYGFTEILLAIERSIEAGQNKMIESSGSFLR